MCSIRFTIQNISDDILYLIIANLISEGRNDELLSENYQERYHQGAKVFFGMVKGKIEFINLFTESSLYLG